MLKFKDYIYYLYKSLFYSKGKLISDSKNLLIFEFKYPFPDDKGKTLDFQVYTPFERARVSDLRERNFLIFFYNKRYGDYYDYKTKTLEKYLNKSERILLHSIKQGKIKDNLPLLSYLLFDWLFLSFCKETFEDTEHIKYGIRDLNRYRRDRVIYFKDALKSSFPIFLVDFFQKTVFKLLRWIREYPLLEETISRFHEIRYINDLRLYGIYKKYRSSFPLNINEFPNQEIMLSKIVGKNEINILKKHIERRKPNIEIRQLT